MRTRLLLATLCMLALPMLFSASSVDGPNSWSPFAPVAFAGHTLNGVYCDCGTTGCICDPGEIGGNSVAVSDASPVKVPSKAKASRSADFDFGSGALLIALAMFIWGRLRA